MEGCYNVNRFTTACSSSATALSFAAADAAYATQSMPEVAHLNYLCNQLLLQEFTK